jgi:hypothetical protein
MLRNHVPETSLNKRGLLEKSAFVFLSAGFYANSGNHSSGAILVATEGMESTGRIANRA